MMRAEQQSRQTDSSTLSDHAVAGNDSSVSDPDAPQNSTDDSSHTTKRIRPDPSSLGTEDLVGRSSASNPDAAMLSPQNSTDDSSPTSKRIRLDPSSLRSKDLGDKSSTLCYPVETMTPVCNAGDDDTPKSKRVDLSPASFCSEDSSVKNSDPVKPVTSDSFSSDKTSRAAGRLRLEPSSVETEDKVCSPHGKDGSSDCASGNVDSKITSTDSGGDTVIMVCDVTVRKADSVVKLEMAWVDGQNRELMHQLLQFFKNRLI